MYLPSHEYLLQEPSTEDLISAVPTVLGRLAFDDRHTIDIALWETVRDLLDADKKQELSRLLIESARAEDWGIFSTGFYAMLIVAYPTNASIQNEVNDLLIDLLNDELTDITTGA